MSRPDEFTTDDAKLALASEWHICLPLQINFLVYLAFLVSLMFWSWDRTTTTRTKTSFFLCTGRWCTVFMLWIKTLSWTLCQLHLVYSHALLQCLLVLSDFLYQHTLCSWSTKATLAPMSDAFISTYHYRWFLLLVREKRFLMLAVVSITTNSF